MANGIDALLRALSAAAPAFAGGLQGFQQGQELQRRRTAEEEERARRAQQMALEQALLQARIPQIQAQTEAARALAEQRHQPQEQEAETPFRVGVGGISTEAPTLQEALAVRERLTPEQQPQVPSPSEARAARAEQRSIEREERQQTEQEAFGNALIIARGARGTVPDPTQRTSNISRIIASQHGLSPGDANRIANEAVQQAIREEQTAGRREQLLEGGGDQDDLLQALLGQAGAQAPPDATAAGAAPAAVPDQLRADIDSELGRGKTADQILSEMQASGVPQQVLQQAQSYLASRR